MQPINKAERTNAFINFLLLFLVTVVVLLAVVFFSIKVPFRQNEQLRERIARMAYEKQIAGSFSQQMQMVLDELKGYEGEGKPGAYTAQRVQDRIEALAKVGRTAPQTDHALYELVVESLNNLNLSKDKLKRLEAEREFGPGR